MWYVYLLRCGDGTFYAGITTNLKRRLVEHRSGQGSRYVRSRGVDKIAYSERCSSRAGALKRESAIRRLSRRQKFILVRKNNDNL